MNCPSCATEIAGGQLYCGRCGTKARAETVEDIQNQIEGLHRRLDEIVQAKTVEQKFLELDTSEKVAKRLISWGKIAGVLLLIPLAALGLWAGKEIKNLHDVARTVREDVAKTVREAIEPIIEAARNEADSAKAIATGALQTSQDVRTQAENAKQQLSELKKEITNREAEVRSLDAEVQKSTAALQVQSKKVEAVAKQVKTVASERNVEAIREANPLFGERYAVADGVGAIDLSKKTAQDIYVMLLLHLKVEGKQVLDDKKVGEVSGSLKERYTLFLKPVILMASTGRSGIGIGVRFDEGSCPLAEPLQSPPCILYFRQALRTTAFEIRNMLRPAQIVPDDRIKFVDPAKMQSLSKELLEKSGIDVIIVLSG